MLLRNPLISVLESKTHDLLSHDESIRLERDALGSATSTRNRLRADYVLCAYEHTTELRAGLSLCKLRRERAKTFADDMRQFVKLLLDESELYSWLQSLQYLPGISVLLDIETRARTLAVTASAAERNHEEAIERITGDINQIQRIMDSAGVVERLQQNALELQDTIESKQQLKKRLEESLKALLNDIGVVPPSQLDSYEDLVDLAPRVSSVVRRLQQCQAAVEDLTSNWNTCMKQLVETARDSYPECLYSCQKHRV